MLSAIVGQERAIRILRESLANERLHHALLFVGPHGVGKRTTAEALAASLLCADRAEDACGACPACVQVAARSHPDLTVVEIPEKRKGISIEQIRGLQSALARRALLGSRKVAVVDHAETLTADAQNAFLKTLEEPPPGSLIVLVTSSASALLPTVRSRCQQIAFTPLPENALRHLLEEREGIDPDEAQRIARYAEGSPGAALALGTDELSHAESHLRGVLDRWVPGDYQRVQKAAEDVATPTGVPLLLRILRQRLREATDAGDPRRIERALEAARAGWRGAEDLDRHANRNLALERMWLAIGRSLSR